MGRLRLLRPAREDLTELRVHIAKNDPRAADRVLDRIEIACTRLKDHPQLGPARPEIGPGARIPRYLSLAGDLQSRSRRVEVVRILTARAIFAKSASIPAPDRN